MANGDNQRPETLGTLGGVDVNPFRRIGQSLNQLPTSLGDVINQWRQGSAQSGYRPGMNASQAIEASGGLDKNISDVPAVGVGSLLGPRGMARLGGNWLENMNLARQAEAAYGSGPEAQAMYRNLYGVGRHPVIQRWMGELSDKDVPFTFPQGQIRPGESATFPLSQYYPHSQLFKAYPELSDLATTYHFPATREAYDQSMLGEIGYNQATRKPYVDIRHYSPEWERNPILRAIFGDDPQAAARSTLAHEVGGHGVQMREGFIGGGRVTPENYWRDVAETSARGVEHGIGQSQKTLPMTFDYRMTDRGQYPYRQQTVDAPGTIQKWDLPASQWQPGQPEPSQFDLLKYLMQIRGHPIP
jgi:hypothetical protein